MRAQVEAWHPCPHIPGCITVNIGDALQIYSDGLLKSNYHRVRMPEAGEPTVRAATASASALISCFPLRAWRCTGLSLASPHCILPALACRYWSCFTATLNRYPERSVT